jgi:hypothetical protein
MRHAAEHPVCEYCGADAHLGDDVPLYAGNRDKQEQVAIATANLSDEDLLIELRNRKRIGRVVGESVAPARYVEMGMPEIIQVEDVFKNVGRELFRLYHWEGQRMPGLKIERGYFEHLGDPLGRDRRVRVVFNYIKDRV